MSWERQPPHSICKILFQSKRRWREIILIIIYMWVMIILTTECKKWGGSSGQRGEQEEGKADQKVGCQPASNITTFTSSSFQTNSRYITSFLSISSFPNKSLNRANIITISKFSFELIKLQLETVFESRFTSLSQLVYVFAFISKINKMVEH